MLDHNTTPLLTALLDCGQRSHTAFYVPGHKRGRGTPAPLLAHWHPQVFQFDLPELPELDDLFAPTDVIAAAQALAAEAFGAEQTWFLTNGSTCGVMASILATSGPEDFVLVPRNAHSSVISGFILSGAAPIFVTPPHDSDLEVQYCLTPDAIQRALAQYPSIKAVVIVSPTYEGICADIAAIAHITHAHGVPLVVDEAHGAHFQFHPQLPPPALAQGADLVIQSTHKTLGALTQAAMLHHQGHRVDPLRVERALRLVQSTSPNYLLLASLDAARHQAMTQGQDILAALWQLTQRTRQQLQQLPHLSLLQAPGQSVPGFQALDETRLTIGLRQWPQTGFALDEQLHDTFNITAELPTAGHLTFVPSLGTSASDLDQLVQAFNRLSTSVTEAERSHPALHPSLLTPELSAPAISPRTAYWSPQQVLPWEKALNGICAELICPYPPGIPIVVPGERITATMLTVLRQVREMGGHITGCADPYGLTVRVVQE